MKRVITVTSMSFIAFMAVCVAIPPGQSMLQGGPPAAIACSKQDDKSGPIPSEPLGSSFTVQSSANFFDSQPLTATAPAKGKTATGPEDILEAKQLLAELGYWTGPIDRVPDQASRHALIAFQKVEGRRRSGRLSPEELQALRVAKRPLPVEAGYSHIEVDLGRQVLFVVASNGTVSQILPISSGAGKPFTSQGRTRRAITPMGNFTVYGKIAGWRKGPLGPIYYPMYFVGGVAIHGNASVPAYPASHGCVRIPTFAAKLLSEMTPIGTVVMVHDGKPPGQKHDTQAASSTSGSWSRLYLSDTIPTGAEESGPPVPGRFAC